MAGSAKGRFHTMTMMTMHSRQWLIVSAVVAAIGVLAAAAWQYYRLGDRDVGIVSGNGRIEAVEIDVAARTAGRLKEIPVHEGEFVTAGQVVAVMDTEVLEAQRRQAEAQLQQGQTAVATARSQLAQRESEKAAAQAAVSQREVELNAARRQLSRSKTLAEKGFVSAQAVDDVKARVDSAQAAVTRRACAGRGRGGGHRQRTLAGRRRAVVRGRRAGKHRADPGRHRRFDAEGAARWPRPVHRRAARRSGRRRRPGAEPARPQRRVHDLLPAHRSGGARRARHRGAAGARRGTAVRDPGAAYRSLPPKPSSPRRRSRRRANARS